MTGQIKTELLALPGFLIRRAHQVSAAILNAELGDLGLTPSQFAVLTVIDATPGRDQISIANIAKLDRSTMTLVMRKLESGGLVTREQDPKDGRRKTLSITAIGQDVLRIAKTKSRNARARQLLPFNDQEAEEFMRLLRQFVDVLENGVSDCTLEG